MSKLLTAIIALCFASAALAQNGLILVDPSSGKYLGNLNSNRYDPNSVSNPYGRYGSQYSTDSINNPYSQYGSPYSNNSARNPYATQAPIVVQPYGSHNNFGSFGSTFGN